MNERLLCLDVGDRRIGIAVSDERRILASVVETYTRVGYSPDVKRIKELCERYSTEYIISGLPMNMDGSEGGQVQKVREFCGQLENAGLKVFYQDERMTTVSAEKILMQGNMRRDDRKKHIDQVAAVFILESYLASGRSPENEIAEAGKMQVGQMVELIDDKGNPCSFEHLMTLEYNEKYYLVLVAEQDTDCDEEGEIVIMLIDKDDKGEDCYVPVEDGDTMQAVYDLYVKTVESEDDVIDDGTEDGD
ncbi:MAG: Holliday junction resolvase RuvX [Eubacteriales bacterium]|nr:Holliday junction resolvase RuvX [Eubacteriales bacterium]MDD3882410.1 Holliday junction resolvase RuvX [Eubacteriales bacterium]MDD4512369.1 Holliday junction resolvase RuvX [Eubacteriales bacterium]